MICWHAFFQRIWSFAISCSRPILLSTILDASFCFSHLFCYSNSLRTVTFREYCAMKETKKFTTTSRSVTFVSQSNIFNCCVALAKRAVNTVWSTVCMIGLEPPMNNSQFSTYWRLTMIRCDVKWREFLDLDHSVALSIVSIGVKRDIYRQHDSCRCILSSCALANDHRLNNLIIIQLSPRHTSILKLYIAMNKQWLFLSSFWFCVCVLFLRQLPHFVASLKAHVIQNNSSMNQ